MIHLQFAHVNLHEDYAEASRRLQTFYKDRAMTLITNTFDRSEDAI